MLNSGEQAGALGCATEAGNNACGLALEASRNFGV
jgi:hypothetical protein